MLGRTYTHVSEAAAGQAIAALPAVMGEAVAASPASAADPLAELRAGVRALAEKLTPRIARIVREELLTLAEAMA